MREQLERLGIEYEFFDAVRGTDAICKRELYDRERAVRSENRELRPGEIGCALSHSEVYAAIAERDAPWALVLEDDAILHHDLPSVLSRLESGILEQGDMVFLERCDYTRPLSAKKLIGDFRIAEPIMVRAGSTAQSAGYVVTRKAAEAIKALNCPVHFPADSWGYYKGLVRFRGIQPTLTLIRQDAAFGSSTLEAGTRPGFKKYPFWRLVVHDFLVYTAAGRALLGPMTAMLKKRKK